VRVHIINPSGEPESESSLSNPENIRRASLLKWAKRQGLNSQQAEDFVDYYENPRGWFGEPERARTSHLMEWARRKNLEVDEKELTMAIENAWFGESGGRRMGALKKWAKRHGLSDADAEEFAEYVENAWYGDPESHRKAAIKGWRLRRTEENPIFPILPKLGVPAEYQEALGISEVRKDWPHAGGILLGLADTSFYSGISEMATGNEWWGTVIGAGLGLGTSEVIRRWYPAEDWRDGLARGQRIGTLGITLFRIVAGGIRAMTTPAEATASGPMGSGLDDVIEKIKQGKIIEAVKIPMMTGLRYDDIGSMGKFLNLSWDAPHMPRLMFWRRKEATPTPTGQEYHPSQMGQEEYPAITQQDVAKQTRQVAISAQDTYKGKPYETRDFAISAGEGLGVS